MKGPARNIKCINKLTPGQPVAIPIHCFIQMLCPSHFRNALPRDPVANAAEFMATEIAQQLEQLVTSVARRTTGQPYAEALGGGTVRQDVPLPRAGHSNKGKGDQAASSSTRKAKEDQGSSPGARNKAHPTSHSSHRRSSSIPWQLLSHSFLDQHTLPKWLVRLARRKWLNR